MGVIRIRSHVSAIAFLGDLYFFGGISLPQSQNLVTFISISITKERISMNQVLQQPDLPFSPQLEQATGSIAYNMTNDYMFKAVLQKNEHVLKGLICSCLHMSPDQIKSILITNLIPLGEYSPAPLISCSQAKTTLIPNLPYISVF